MSPFSILFAGLLAFSLADCDDSTISLEDLEAAAATIEVEQTDDISSDMLRKAFGEEDDGMQDIDRKQSALHILLNNSTEGETNQIVEGVDPTNGLEAYRRIIRRWDPVSGERQRFILKQIINPERAPNLEKLSVHLEAWLQLIQRYERQIGRAHV